MEGEGGGGGGGGDGGGQPRSSVNRCATHHSTVDYFAQLQTFQMKLIMFLSIADFFGSMTYLIGGVAGHGADHCDQGFFCTLTAAM